MNAIDLLKADHERVKNILTQLSESTDRGIKKRSELLSKLEMEITIHTKLEEEILYPAFKEAGGKEEEEMYYEAKEEHRTVDSLVLPDLKATDPGTPEFSGRVKVVKELLEHHIEEEETDMFPQAILWWLLGSLIIGSAIGVFYYLRVMVTLFLVTPGLHRHDAPENWGQRTGGIMLMVIAALTLLLGVYPQPLLELLQHTALNAL